MTKSNLQQVRLGIGLRLWEARTAKGLSQLELGKLSGFNQAVVQQVEDGVLRQPSVVSGLTMAMSVAPAWVQWGEWLEDGRVK